MVFQASVDALYTTRFGIDAQTPGFQLLHNVAVSRRQRPTFDTPQAVTVKFQRPGGSYSRVQLSQAAGGSVARIGKGFFVVLPLPLVEFRESFFRHEHFATHFQYGRIILPDQSQRYGLDSSNVLCHVLTGKTIPTGGAAHEDARFVQKADRQSVELGLR